MNTLPTYRLIAAGILLLVYLIIAGILLALLYNPGDHVPEWNQVLVVFNAVGALATTAAGVLLGVDIQQANVDRAQQSAERNAAIAARKDAAILTALGHLDAPGAAAAAAAGNQDLSAARSALQTGLAAPAPIQ